MLECLNVRMFRLETTRTTGKDNFIKERGLTRPRFFCGDIIRSTGGLEEGKGKSPYFIQTFEHSNIQTFSQLELTGVVRAGRSRVEDVRRDEVDDLPEDRVYYLRCFWWGCFHNPVGYRKSPPDTTLNFHRLRERSERMEC